MPPKGYIAIAVALLLGLVVGRWVPQADLREAREQLAELRRNPAGKKSVGGVAAVAGVQSILKSTEHTEAQSDSPRQPRKHRRSPKPNTESTATATTGATQQLAHTSGTTQALAQASISNQLDQVRDGWIMRTQIARANFVSRTELNEQQTMDFEVLVEAMNLRLGASIDDWVARVSEKGQVTSEDGVRILNEVSSALVLSYNDMDRKLPADWRAKAGPRFELVNLVDPDVLSPLQEIEGLIDHTAKSAPPDETSEFGARIEFVPDEAAPP